MSNDPQFAVWNGNTGAAWVASQDLVDRTLRPLQDLLVEPFQPTEAPLRVLDVGCGTGGTTVALARALGPTATITGVDVSSLMVEAARARAASDHLPISFTEGDAASHPFPPASFDLIVSRFGVMFFADPTAAFAHLRAAARPGAALRMLSWRGPEENPFMTTVERAAAPLLPDLPVRVADEPGQFGLAGEQRVRTILADAGWTDVTLQPVDPTCALPAAELPRYATGMGPVGALLPTLDEPLRRRVAEVAVDALATHVDGDELRFTAACWLIEAVAP
ncbi:class I SAM-dependent methyltransferase [Patulibacter defluvii]|uniref:class I SAM-dependent methyltransferase n=1 Tax=Patulibacter defluvii TaxID=3095358 RepID=UPI002A74D5F2|nr:class I SAM-dependent methyltransferase [Patulibacter sp. DM4]